MFVVVGIAALCVVGSKEKKRSLKVTKKKKEEHAYYYACTCSKKFLRLRSFLKSLAVKTHKKIIASCAHATCVRKKI